MTEDERKSVLKLAAQLTGVTLTGDLRLDALVANVQRRIEQTGTGSLVGYLSLVEADESERAHLISALGIHTTSWFRENPHFVAFQEHLLSAVENKEVFRVWCAACSTGEEVYSFALALEEFRTVHAGFEYELLGTDVDPISVAVASRAIYPERHMNFHLKRYRHHLLAGSGPTEGYFTLSKAIRTRCRFQVLDLRQIHPPAAFHVVICRNVLIYFDHQTVKTIVTALVHCLRPGGRLVLGHSEAVNGALYGLVQKGHSVYTKPAANAEAAKVAPRRPGRTRVLSVDDSLLTRKFLEKTFKDFGFEVTAVGSASEATNFLNFNDVDLVTLDLNMPDVSGEKWLQQERRDGLKTPVVILSEAHAADVPAVVRLLALGAQEYVEKSRLAAQPTAIRELMVELVKNTQTPHATVTSIAPNARPQTRPEVILIGASTGGPQALTKLLTELPSGAPPIVVTQHISAKFAKPLFARLCEESNLRMGRNQDLTPLLPGHLYMSDGDYHVGVELVDHRLVLRTSNEPTFNGHRPSVDFLFNSALGLPRPILAMLLTGMGRDGALGLRFLHQEGAFCVAQSEADCIVYGMPREAVERGATDFVGTIEEIRALMLHALALGARAA